MRYSAVVLLLLGACADPDTPVGDGDGVVDAEELPGVGWTAEINTLHHDVAGTAKVIDENTIEITGWTFDGGGLDARLFLLADGEAFHDTWPVSENLVGTSADNETLTLTIPDGVSFDEWNLITMWCITAGVSFGNGVFSEPME